MSGGWRREGLFTRSVGLIHSRLAFEGAARLSGPEGSGVRDHAGDLLVVGVGNQHALGEVALGFRLLRRQNVPHFGLAAHKFARAGLFEALGGAPMGLEFGHAILLGNCVLTAGLSIANEPAVAGKMGVRGGEQKAWSVVFRIPVVADRGPLPLG